MQASLLRTGPMAFHLGAVEDAITEIVAPPGSEHHRVGGTCVVESAESMPMRIALFPVAFRRRWCLGRTTNQALA